MDGWEQRMDVISTDAYAKDNDKMNGWNGCILRETTNTPPDHHAHHWIAHSFSPRSTPFTPPFIYIYLFNADLYIIYSWTTWLLTRSPRLLVHRPLTNSSFLLLKLSSTWRTTLPSSRRTCVLFKSLLPRRYVFVVGWGLSKGTPFVIIVDICCIGWSWQWQEGYCYLRACPHPKGMEQGPSSCYSWAREEVLWSPSCLCCPTSRPSCS